MERIETTTTAFKKALKTVTDLLTDKEIETYDVGIGLRYKGTTGTLLMEHPENGMAVCADFEGEPTTAELDTLFYSGSLLTALKAFRKKEPLYIEEEVGTVLLSSELGLFYESVAEEDRVHFPARENSVTADKQTFLNALTLCQTVTKTSFHPSTKTIRGQVVGQKLHLHATNFAQVVLAQIGITEPVEMPFSFVLPVGLVTKVRNTIARGTGKTVTVYQSGQTVVLKTTDTCVSFENDLDVTHLDLVALVKRQSWETPLYAYDAGANHTVVTEAYEALRQAETEKDGDASARHATLYMALDPITQTLTVSKEVTPDRVYTRDLYALSSKWTGNWSVAKSAGGLLFHSQTDKGKTLVLIPISHVAP